MNDTTYDTIDAFIEAHEGLWFNRIKEIKCQSNYGKKNVM